MRIAPVLAIVLAAGVAHAEDRAEPVNRTTAGVPLIAIGASLFGAGAGAIIVGSILEVNVDNAPCLRNCQNDHTLPDATIGFGVAGAFTGAALFVTGLLLHTHHARVSARANGIAISF
jgi:hypothetical protein